MRQSFSRLDSNTRCPTYMPCTSTCSSSYWAWNWMKCNRKIFKAHAPLLDIKRRVLSIPTRKRVCLLFFFLSVWCNAFVLRIYLCFLIWVAPISRDISLLLAVHCFFLASGGRLWQLSRRGGCLMCALFSVEVSRIGDFDHVFDLLRQKHIMLW